MPVCIDVFTKKPKPFSPMASTLTRMVKPFAPLCIQPVVAVGKTFMDGTAYNFMDGTTFEFN